MRICGLSLIRASTHDDGRTNSLPWRHEILLIHRCKLYQIIFPEAFSMPQELEDNHSDVERVLHAM